MSLAINKEQLAALAMKEAMAWLDQRGVYYQHFPPDQIKIGPINFWPRTGTITVDGEGQRRAEKGLAGLNSILAANGKPPSRSLR
jgi:hypothetical protein